MQPYCEFSMYPALLESEHSYYGTNSFVDPYHININPYPASNRKKIISILYLKKKQFWKPCVFRMYPGLFESDHSYYGLSSYADPYHINNKLFPASN